MITIDFTTKPQETLPEYIVDQWGNKFLFDENEHLHSYNDLPAVVYSDGEKRWFVHGFLKRINNLPTIIKSDGTEIFYTDESCNIIDLG